MRKLTLLFTAAGAIVALLVAGILVWRRNPRMGTAFVNSVVNPALIRRGLSGRGRSEIGTIEHVGRRSGSRRLTPVHPEPTADGFRIIVPIGERSEWARNVISAGRCRLQLHDVVYELDEPSLISPCEIPGLPRVVCRLEDVLGFKYLQLRQFSGTPGALEPPDVDTAVPGEADQKEVVLA